jgi:hypothetical protein
MPLARYFFFVGGILLALLFISDAYLPKLPEAHTADADLTVIRIHSDRKWPERVVFDTSTPAVSSMQIANADAGRPSTAKVADVPDQTRVRMAFAQLPSPEGKQLQPSKPKIAQPKLQYKHKTVARRSAPAPVLAARQPQLGFADNGIANPDASRPSTAKVPDVSTRAQARTAFAQPQSSDARQLQPKLKHYFKLAKRHSAPALVVALRQPQSGFSGNSVW